MAAKKRTGRPPIRPNEPLEKMLVFRVSAKEADSLRKQAADQNTTMTAIFRAAMGLAPLH